MNKYKLHREEQFNTNNTPTAAEQRPSYIYSLEEDKRSKCLLVIQRKCVPQCLPA